MAIKCIVKNGDISQAMRDIKKRMQREGIWREIKIKEHIKKAERKAEKMRYAISQRQRRTTQQKGTSTVKRRSNIRVIGTVQL